MYKRACGQNRAQGFCLRIFNFALMDVWVMAILTSGLRFFFWQFSVWCLINVFKINLIFKSEMIFFYFTSMLNICSFVSNLCVSLSYIMFNLYNGYVMLSF